MVLLMLICFIHAKPLCIFISELELGLITFTFTAFGLQGISPTLLNALTHVFANMLRLTQIFSLIQIDFGAFHTAEAIRVQEYR